MRVGQVDSGIYGSYIRQATTLFSYDFDYRYDSFKLQTLIFVEE